MVDKEKMYNLIVGLNQEEKDHILGMLAIATAVSNDKIFVFNYKTTEKKYEVIIIVNETNNNQKGKL